MPIKISLLLNIIKNLKYPTSTKIVIIKNVIILTLKENFFTIFSLYINSSTAELIKATPIKNINDLVFIVSKENVNINILIKIFLQNIL